MSFHPLPSFGAFDGEDFSFDDEGLARAARRFREPAMLLQGPDGRVGVGFGDRLTHAGPFSVFGILPGLYPEFLGDRSFLDVHGCRFPYVVGEMANGIATARMVIEAHRHGFLGFFGAAGLSPSRVAAAIREIQKELGSSTSWGSNLIHSPHEPDLEDAIVDLYLSHGVTRVSASAYMDLTPMVVRYAASGLFVDDNGNIQRTHHVFAKVSRPEVAQRFLQPMPGDVLAALVQEHKLTEQEAHLASLVPVATDVTVEADSGGHTDNQALPAVFPTIVALRNLMVQKHGYQEHIRVGAAGGLGTPSSIASAFAMGAAYVLTGSINQSAVESGLSLRGKSMLAGARLGDMTMAPAADMFEMGVKVQVLRRGTLFSARAHKLYELYRAHEAWEEISDAERARVEKDILRCSFAEAWSSTQAFFAKRNPAENDKAAFNPKYKMALVFRSYLGQASKWAIAGDDVRALDYQVWSGPAMGAFNVWAEDSFLADLSSRTVGQIGLNLLEGAAQISRATQFRAHGIPMPNAAFSFPPRPLVAHGTSDSTDAQRDTTSATKPFFSSPEAA